MVGGPALSDGAYEALVVDAGQAADGSAILDLTIVSGSHKGEVVAVRAGALPMDPLDVLGLPVALTVVDGQPSVAFDT